MSCPRPVAGRDWDPGLQFLAQHMSFFVILQLLFLSSATSGTCGGEVTPMVTRDLGLEREPGTCWRHPQGSSHRCDPKG